MKPHVAVVLLSLALLAAGCAGSLEGHRWIAIQTEHFEFLSDDDEQKSVELAREFEVFHSFMEQMSGGEKFTPRIPTVVYLFKNQETYRSFGPSRTAGYFNATARANYIAVGKSTELTDTRIPFHEYSHYMMRRKGLFGYPMWYDEGHAEFVGTARVRDGRFELGRAPTDRVDILVRFTAMQLKRMVTAQNVSEWPSIDVAQLYATGWLFVHYLYNSAYDGKENRWVQKDDFLARINQGTDPEEAFRTAFGADFRRIEKELDGYLKDLKVLSLPVERFGQVAEPRVRAVAAPEAMTRLAELLVALGDPKRATDLLERALVLDPQQPRTRALLGRALGASERHPEAEAMFAKAVEQEPDSALTHVDYGLYLTSRAIQRDANTVRIQPTDLPAEQRADYLKRGRAEYERAIALDGSLPEAHTELAFTYLAPGEPAAEAIPHADRAFDLLPSNSTVALQLAEVLIASGKLDEARPLLTRLLPQASASRKYKAYLDELMARVAQGQSAAQ